MSTNPEASPFDREIKFLRRKLPGVMIEWEERPVIDQILSPKQSASESTRLFERMKTVLSPRAKEHFEDIIKIITVRSDNSTRVIIHVGKLREFFADEIDGWSGGGGRKMKPVQTPGLSRR